MRYIKGKILNKIFHWLPLDVSVLKLILAIALSLRGQFSSHLMKCDSSNCIFLFKRNKNGYSEKKILALISEGPVTKQ